MSQSGTLPGQVQAITPLQQTAFDEIKKVCKQARITDLQTNGKILTDDQIREITTKISDFEAAHPAEQQNRQVRYSKKFLNEVLGVHIDRGGIIRERDPKTGKYTLYALYKSVQKDGKNKSVSLGKGSFGKVKVMQNQATGELEALKVIKSVAKSQTVKNQQLQALHEEMRLTAVVGLGSHFEMRKARTSAERNEMHLAKPLANKFYIRLKLLRGNTLEAYLKSGLLVRQDRFYLMLKILEDLQQIHDKGILHRDLKPANIMWNRHSKEAKIFDFGFSKDISKVASGKVTDNLLGTPLYISPEIAKDQEYSHASDVYAAGRVVQQLFGIVDTVRFQGQKGEIGLIDPAVQKQFTPHERAILQMFASRLIDSKPEARLTIPKAILELNYIFHHINNPLYDLNHYAFVQEALSLIDNINKLNKLQIFPPIVSGNVFENSPVNSAKIRGKALRALTLSEYYRIMISERVDVTAYETHINKIRALYEEALRSLPDQILAIREMINLEGTSADAREKIFQILDLIPLSERKVFFDKLNDLSEGNPFQFQADDFFFDAKETIVLLNKFSNEDAYALLKAWRGFIQSLLLTPEEMYSILLIVPIGERYRYFNQLQGRFSHHFDQHQAMYLPTLMRCLPPQDQNRAVKKYKDTFKANGNAEPGAAVSIPLLEDIPVLTLFFRGEDFQDYLVRNKNAILELVKSVDDVRSMMPDDLSDRHKDIVYQFVSKKLDEIILDFEACIKLFPIVPDDFRKEYFAQFEELILHKIDDFLNQLPARVNDPLLDVILNLPDDEIERFILSLGEDRLRKLKGDATEFDYVMAFISDNKREKVKLAIDAYLMPVNTVQDMFNQLSVPPSGLFPPVKNSAETLAIFEKAKKPDMTSSERYFLLKDYISDAKNASEPFYQSITSKYGRESFNVFPKLAVTPVTSPKNKF